MHLIDEMCHGRCTKLVTYDFHLIRLKLVGVFISSLSLSLSLFLSFFLLSFLLLSTAFNRRDISLELKSLPFDIHCCAITVRFYVNLDRRA